jgi:hypothetical protein
MNTNNQPAVDPQPGEMPPPPRSKAQQAVLNARFGMKQRGVVVEASHERDGGYTSGKDKVCRGMCWI